MKKIINGKVYDTETSTQVGSHGNGLGWSDFKNCEETLYRKKTGEFFLHGKGGAMTRYAESAGNNSWAGGEKLIPLDVETAKEWAEANLDTDEYESIFGVVSEDDEDVNFSARIPASVSAKLRQLSAEAGMSQGAFIIQLIKNA